MKHAKKQKNTRIEKQKKRIKVLLIMLVITWAIAVATIYRDYQMRPGFLEKIWIADRGADFITVAWEKPRNVYRYVITYNGNAISVSGIRSEMKITNLEEDKEYKITVRADSKRREGFETLTEIARTKRSQSIAGDNHQLRFANIEVNLNQVAQTGMTFTSDNKTVKIMGDKVMFTHPGKAVILAKAEESEEYASSQKKITVEVLDTIYVDAEGAEPHIFYKLNKDNCERVMSINGTEKETTPQSFEYTDGYYNVVYVAKGNKTQRVIRFGRDKDVYKPKADLGHGNGITIANGINYVVKGNEPTCVSFDQSNNNYNRINLPYDTSGIAYDKKNGMFYTSQYKGMTTYDKDFNEVNRFKRIKRTGKHYPQDSGAYGGIMMHCVSGEDSQATNYIDFYDMLHKKYLGSIECELNEVESLLVDEEGYIELLSNVDGPEDYIWKTPINIKRILD